MWQEFIKLINDPMVSGIIANFLGNTLSTPISEGLKKLFQKKHEEKVLTIEQCKQMGIKEEDLKALLEEIMRLTNNKIVIGQVNEEGKNVNEVSGLSQADQDVTVMQTNKTGDNNLKISF